MDNEKKGNLFSNFADGEPLNPGAPGQGSGRVRGRRKEGAGDGEALQIQHSNTVHNRATVRVLNRELGLARQVRNIYLGTYFFCIR